MQTTKKQYRKENKMEIFLKSRVLGQNHVCNIISNAIAKGEKNLNRENKPRGIFLFTGPTGTGKTECAKQVTKFLGIEFCRFDMSEYQNREKFLEDFFFRVGNLEKNKQRAIILLDEIEKGNMQIFDYFLQIFDEAQISNGKEILKLNNHYFIMTSNIGSKDIVNQKDFNIAKQIVENKVKATFRIEFLARIPRQNQICFAPLSFEIMQSICKLKIDEELEFLRSRGYNLSYEEDIVPFLMTEGISAIYGARDVVQIVQSYIHDAILASPHYSGKLILKQNAIKISF